MISTSQLAADNPAISQITTTARKISKIQTTLLNNNPIYGINIQIVYTRHIFKKISLDIWRWKYNYVTFNFILYRYMNMRTREYNKRMCIHQVSPFNSLIHLVWIVFVQFIISAFTIFGWFAIIKHFSVYFSALFKKKRQ